MREHDTIESFASFAEKKKEVEFLNFKMEGDGEMKSKRIVAG